MSIIDTAGHSVVAYVAGTTKPFSGQRLSKVTYKTITDKDSAMYGIKRDSKCVSLPPVASNDVIANVQILAPVIAEYLQTVQDKIVRERIDCGAASISVQEISIAACIEWLDSNNESGRITKDSVNQWFDTEISDNLAMVLAEKLGVSAVPTDAESKQVELVLSTFRDKISSLAGGKTSYEPKLCTSLLKVLELAPSGDAMASRFVVRLNKMIADNSANSSLMDLL